MDQALIDLASAAGTAVASAAGTDAWNGLRERVARLFGRAAGTETGAVVERLDRTAAALDGAGPPETERVRIRLAASWQARFEDLLEDLDEAGRAEIAGQLRDLVAEARRAAPGPSAGDGGLAVGGNVDIRADHGSAAAGVMGDVTLGNPPPPGPAQG
ncbi:hypothetical protein [Streptomyces griseocarneus]|uniref:hypothetical protein n=1 Tax=Streptomyces griseocarneus TaxID=51201 RepID=UPI00167D6D6B|nr:hypothetical protein [Streptomyces griseocarneus]MBZ6475236.1 hypothetical protein [Streptomyces griseocarneus]GHG61489.1 hypothetical protein GCM10018779_29420 [Streptomyces griseocarneus]